MVTVVGESQCKKGFEFVFGGPLADCRDCKVRNVCFHLEQNKWYKVTEIRDVHHECRIHEGGVRVVEVEKIPIQAAVPTRIAVEGSMMTFEETDCDVVGCAHYRLCKPFGPGESVRYQISKVLDTEVECSKGRSLKVVLLD
ncbi:MAG: hypothetical protein A3K60_08275 [Euryarchaeota archaeon RBG_19FT_COMBO_56_21]|nr:MAG: hypothetical protein A3K60_08275 [Euryarchaeota archaeon RBG_19FT_COMBO_56_21]